jgi:hypothetical protein
VEIHEIDMLPALEGLVYDLSDRNSLTQLLVNVSKTGGNVKRQDDIFIRNYIAKDQNKESKFAIIQKKSMARWVFVAGNIPIKIKSLSKRENTKYKKEIEAFSGNLSEQLLADGFCIAACPQVPQVGFKVIEAALKINSKNKKGDIINPVEFKFRGVHPIDPPMASGSPLVEGVKDLENEWHNHIMEFRGSYLKDQEWLIVIGGNQGTRDEYQAAKECKEGRVKVFAVPCFGGKSKEIWGEDSSSRHAPCAECKNGKNGSCGAEGIKKIVASLK